MKLRFFSNLAKSSRRKTRKIPESAITLCDLTSFFKWTKKILTYNQGNHVGREPLRGQRWPHAGPQHMNSYRLKWPTCVFHLLKIKVRINKCYVINSLNLTNTVLPLPFMSPKLFWTCPKYLVQIQIFWTGVKKQNSIEKFDALSF